MSGSNLLRVGLRALITLGLMGCLLWSIGPENVIEQLGHVRVELFVLACLLFVVSQGLTAWRWERLLSIPGIERPGFVYLFGLVMIGMFSNFFLPSSMGGDVVRGEFLQARMGGRRHAYSSIFFDRFLAFLATLLIGIGAMGFAYFRFGWVDSKLCVAIGIFFIPVLAVALLMRTRLADKVLRFSRETPLARMAGFGERVLEAIRAYGSDVKTLSFVFGLSIAVQVVGNILTVWYMAESMQLRVPFYFHFIAMPIVLLITLLPVSINGIGLREGVFVYVYGKVGVAPEAATALSISWTLMLALISLGGGFLLLRSKQYRWTRAAR